MAFYTVVLIIGFMLAFPLIGALVIYSGWRKTWWIVGLALMFGLAPLSWLLVRRSPESLSLQPDVDNSKTIETDETDFSFTLRQALQTPAYWLFGIAGEV